MSSSSSSEEEWEDVECLPPLGLVAGATHATTGRDGKATAVEIVLPAKGSIQRKRKQNALERAMAAFNRDFRQSLHKASLLCLLAQGLRISDSCNDPVLQAKLLSLVPRELHLTPSDKLRKILKWFVARKSHLLAAVTAEEGEGEESVNRDRTEEEFRSGCVRTVEMLVSILRALSLRVRLVLALRPIPFKPSQERATFLSSPDRDLSQLEGMRQRVYDPTAPPSSRDPTGPPLSQDPTAPPSSQDPTGPPLSQDPTAPPLSQDPTAPPSFQDPSLPLGEPSAPLMGAMFLKLMQQLKKKGTSDCSVECSSSDMHGSLRETEDAEGSSSTARVRGRRKRGVVGSSGGSRGEGGGGPVKKRKVSSEASDTHDKCSPADSSEGNSSKTRAKGKRKGAIERKTPTTMSDTSPYFSKGRTDRDGESMEDDSDTDFLPSRKKTLKRVLFESSGSGEDGAPGDGACGVKCDDGDDGKGKVKRLNKGKMVKGRAQKSQKLNSEVREKKREESLPIGVYDETSSWAEVFMEDQKRYVCLHLPSSSIDLPKMCEKHYPHKFSYIIATENKCATCVTDVTARYATEWCTATRRERLTGSWWKETLEPYAASREEREREEDDIMNILYSHPLPTSINDYKSHPLYALTRHLLKFEAAIYPPDSEILGYCKSEPVFSRSCVFTLHTRETWLKEGRVVKKDELPYKVVKARPKKGQSSLERDNSTVEVFGPWQTMVYVPPPVVDGVVPRNEYGNVELFQPSMLPAGACHIRIPGIQRVARKLDISYAPAMMGWDFHSGHCCPVIEGVVVAEENRELLLEAWSQEEQLIIEKQMKKRECRILERWKKLTRGVLIRERVQRTYSLD